MLLLLQVCEKERVSLSEVFLGFGNRSQVNICFSSKCCAIVLLVNK